MLILKVQLQHVMATRSQLSLFTTSDISDLTKIKAFGTNTPAIFSSGSSICGSFGQQLLLHTGPSVRDEPLRGHRACFHMCLITVRQKIEKIVSKERELPNLWSRAGKETGMWSCGVMVTHEATSLHLSGMLKNMDAPRPFGGKSLFSPLLSS